MTGMQAALTWTRKRLTHGKKSDIADDCLEQLFLLLRVVLAPMIGAQHSILFLHRKIVCSARTLT
jgi:hypothetical protein